MYFTSLSLFVDLIRKRVQYWSTQKHFLFIISFFLFNSFPVTVLHNKRGLVGWWFVVFCFLFFVFFPEGKPDTFKEGC